MRVWLILFALVGARPGYGAELSERLDHLVKNSPLKKDEFAAVVAAQRNGQVDVLWSVRPNESMTPASLTKILTAAAILDGLGPSRKLETRLLSAGKIENGELQGDLILQGGGDPNQKQGVNDD
jgi:serine-type D-Ala-D-Ala carboxypeptidase/endopeptidase (penicillin-binding protein 4)